MTRYEELLCEYNDEIEVYEEKMISSGLYADGVVWINKYMNTNKKCCILAEEIGHHKTTVGDILEQGNIKSIKQEHTARAWAVDKLLPFEDFLRAFGGGMSASG